MWSRFLVGSAVVALWGGCSCAGAAPFEPGRDAAVSEDAERLRERDAGACGANGCDAGGADAGARDAGAPDAGASDASTPDAGVPVGCTRRVGPERDTVLRDATRSVAASSIVWDGRRYAIVWTEIATIDPVTLTLFVAFVDREGNVLATPRRIFGDDARSLSEGAIALGPEGYGLAFIRGDERGASVARRAYFVRLDRMGAVVPGTEVALTTEHAPHASPALAWSEPLATWTATLEGTEPLGGGFVHGHILAVRLDAGGAVVDTPRRLDALASARSDLATSLAWAGDRFAVAIGEYASASSTRVVIVELDPETGEVSRRIPVGALARPGYLSLASDGAQYGVAWAEIDWGRVYFARAAVGGDALGDPTPIEAGPGTARAQTPTVLFDGATYRVALDVISDARGQTWLARFDATGALIAPAAPMFESSAPHYASGPRLATDGCDDIVVWTSNTASSATLHMHVPRADAD